MDSDQDIVRSGAESLRLVLSPGALLAPWDLPGLPYRRFVDAVLQFNTRMRGIIDERRRTPGNRRDVLSELIQARDEAGSLKDAEVIGHASVIYAASHETTGNALTWTLFLLSQHPSWHHAVCDEVRSVIGEREPRLLDLDRLEILGDVILEALRLMPAAPWTTRIAATNTEIAGHPIPRGTEVVLSIFHTHRHEPCFDEPDRFNPGRWKAIRPDVFQFNAFSAGPRACIGSGFAQLEIRTVLALVLGRFRLELDGSRPIDPILNITMAPRQGMPMFVRNDTDFGAGVGKVRGSISRIVNLS